MYGQPVDREKVKGVNVVVKMWEYGDVDEGENPHELYEASDTIEFPTRSPEENEKNILDGLKDFDIKLDASEQIQLGELLNDTRAVLRLMDEPFRFKRFSVELCEIYG